MNIDEVILVTEEDKVIGSMDKLAAHKNGLLHRAFSIFIFDERGRMLLQQRAAGKYHGALLWTNACCSHPYPGEELESAVLRRLKEELGIDTSLEKLFVFTYYAIVENGLVEHELDHVYIGKYGGPLLPDKNEVAAYKYVDLSDIKSDLSNKPECFTTWFRLAFPKLENWWIENYKEDC